MSKAQPLEITIREMIEQRSLFRCAPGADSTELPLREKQALVDEILRGARTKDMKCYHEETEDSGPVIMITKGYPQISAILDFVDGKFPTWTEAEMKQYQRNEV